MKEGTINHKSFVISFPKDMMYYMLLITPYMEPLLFKQAEYSLIDNVYSILKILSLSIFVYIKYQETSMVSKFFINIVFIEGLLILSTILHAGDLIRLAGPTVSIIGYSIATDIFLPRLREYFFEANAIILFVLSVITAITVILFPGGMKGIKYTYFLGSDNRFVFYTIPMMYMAVVYSLVRWGTIRLFAMICMAISLYLTISTWAVGGMLGTIAFVLGVFVLYKLPYINKLKMGVYVGICFVTSILVAIFRIQYLFSDLIINTLHKDISLSGRTINWDRAIDLIRTHLWIGIGTQSIGYMKGALYGNMAHAHNEILQHMIETGIVGMCLYILLFILLIKSADRIHDNRIRCVCCMTVFTILFMGIADTLDQGIFFMIYSSIFLFPHCFPHVYSKENREVVRRGSL